MKKLIPHFFVIFAFLVLTAMGTWQVQRREWKQDLMAKIDSRINQDPISLSDFKNIDEDEFKPMKVSGNWNHDKQMILLNKSYNGKAGYFVITPLKAESGEEILVNRGWVPSDKDPQNPADIVEVTGAIRATQKLNAIGKVIMLPNTPEKNQWFWIDLPAMYKAHNLPEKPFYLDMINETDKKTYPLALPQKIELYNEHLQYAITWYSLAVALLVMYYFRFFRKKK